MLATCPTPEAGAVGVAGVKPVKLAVVAAGVVVGVGI